MSLALAGIDVAIGGVGVIRQADLVVPSGKVCGLVGRNGAGKTTLMRAIMGFLPAQRGSIRFADRELTSLPAHKRAGLGIGYMPEDRKLVPDFTVADNILLPVWSTDGEAAALRLDRVLAVMPELKLLAERRASQLSGGQQKMAALARALIAGTGLLLLDEPSEGLAPALTQRLAGVIAELRGTGLTVLIAESSSAHLGDLFDEIFLIERGSVTRSS